MGKRCKKKQKQQQQSNSYSLLDCEARPVIKTDKWCRIKIPKGQVPIGDAPFGYVITIPYILNQNTCLDSVNGYIVRSKNHCGKLICRLSK